MFNVQTDVKGNILTLTVDLSQEKGLSSSGKTIIVASSEGNVDVAGHPGTKFGLNVYRYPDVKKGRPPRSPRDSPASTASTAASSAVRAAGPIRTSRGSYGRSAASILTGRSLPGPRGRSRRLF